MQVRFSRLNQALLHLLLFNFRRARLCVTISRQFVKRAESILNGTSSYLTQSLLNVFSANMGEVRNSCVLGVVGSERLCWGLDFLIDAVAHLRSRHPPMRVLLVGDGPIRSQIEAQVERLQLQEVVQFTGFVPPPRVPEFLQRMEVCIIADSNAQGSPMKLFEYMAMNKATVAPSDPPIAEVIEDGVASPSSPEGLEKHTWQESVRTLLRELQIPTATCYGM